MMGGLAYMTGRPGDPLRAGTSVNDIMGGMFAAIATLGALIQRGVTGRGMEVQSALFENNVFLMGQHMLQFAVTGRHPAPMPARDNPWAIYDVFTVADGEQIFLAAVSDAQWLVFCDVLGLPRPQGRSGLCDEQPARRAAPAAARAPARAPREAKGRRARRDHGARGAAVRADPEAGGSLRRPAPPRHRRTRRRAPARWRQGGGDRQDDAAAVHDGRLAPRRAARPAAARRAHARRCCRRSG